MRPAFYPSTLGGLPANRYYAATPEPPRPGVSPAPIPAPVGPGDPLPLGMPGTVRPPDAPVARDGTGAGFGAPGPDAPAPVDAVVAVLRQDGEAAGLRLAGRYGPAMVEGARAYIRARAWTEEELAAEIARHRAARARLANPPPDFPLEFLEKRIAEVRASRAKAQTPPQAVADKPEIARHGIPPWVSYAGLAIGAVSLLYAITRPTKGKE